MNGSVGVAWEDGITDDRQRELRSRFHQGFVGFRLTGADVYWLAACTLAAITEGEPLANASPAGILNAQHRLTEAKDDVLLRVSLNFSALDLTGAQLGGAQLAGAMLGRVNLTNAALGAADLTGAHLGGACLTGAFLDRAQLVGAVLREANLERASLRWAKLNGADLGSAVLDDALLRNADLGKVERDHTQRDETQLIGARLIRVDLREANLIGANCIQADFTDAYLYESHLEGALFTRATLIGCDLRRATLNGESRLNDAHLNLASLEQLRLGDINLAVVEWREVAQLGDEIEAEETHKREYRYDKGRRVRLKGKKKTHADRAKDYRAAARAYRSLAVALNGQGLAREGTRFQYRAEVMARKATYHQGNCIRWSFSLALDTFAGYGIHQIWRLLLTYLSAIAIFGVIYWAIGQYFGGPPIGVINAALLSFSSFHGRGIGIGSNVNLSDPMRLVAIAEGVVGVLIEALLVAALVRRVTGE